MVDQIQMPPSAYSVAPSGRVKRAKRDKRDRRQQRFAQEQDKDHKEQDAAASEQKKATPPSAQPQSRHPDPPSGVGPGRKPLAAKRKQRRGKRIDIRI